MRAIIRFFKVLKESMIANDYEVLLIIKNCYYNSN